MLAPAAASGSDHLERARVSLELGEQVEPRVEEPERNEDQQAGDEQTAQLRAKEARDLPAQARERER